MDWCSASPPGRCSAPISRVCVAICSNIRRQMQLTASHEMELTRLRLSPVGTRIVITDDPVAAFADADWIILLAGSPRDMPGRRVSEMLKRNGAIYVEHGRAINKASPAARILVVSSPCNANCMIAMSHAPDVPQEHWFALNRLDGMRATALIAEKAGVPVGHVNRVTVWGNHSELQITSTFTMPSLMKRRPTN